MSRGYGVDERKIVNTCACQHKHTPTTYQTTFGVLLDRGEGNGTKGVWQILKLLIRSVLQYPKKSLYM